MRGADLCPRGLSGGGGPGRGFDRGPIGGLARGGGIAEALAVAVGLLQLGMPRVQGLQLRAPTKKKIRRQPEVEVRGSGEQGWC